MTDPRDHWDDGSRGLASELLRTGRSERASLAARSRAQQALLSGAAASGLATAKAGAWVTSLKWLGGSVLLLGAGSGLWRLASSATREVERPTELSSGPTRVARDTAERRVVSSAAASEPPPLASILPTRNPAPRQDSAAVARQAPSSSAPSRASAAAVSPAVDPRLAQELLAVKTARAAITQGAPAQALAALDAVAGGFRVLPLEASLVRIDALRATGQREAARALAEQLLREHPDGPYTERLRALAY